MANTKIAVLVIIVVILLQVSSSVVALRYANNQPYEASFEHGTPATTTVNGFERGGGPAECDGHFHSDGDMIVSLSTRWYAGGHRCHKRIRITSVHNGRTVEAKVVDECDSGRGCRSSIVDSSPAVWKALGLDTKIGEAPVTWSDASTARAQRPFVVTIPVELTDLLSILCCYGRAR